MLTEHLLETTVIETFSRKCSVISVRTRLLAYRVLVSAKGSTAGDKNCNTAGLEQTAWEICGLF
jgi:hypothetical protein